DPVHPRERGFDLGETGDGAASLVRHGKSIERGAFQEPLSRFDQVRGDPYLPLEAPGERLAAERAAQRRPSRRDPNPTPRQAPLQIGDNGTIRRQHEPDHVVDWRYRSGCRTEPFAAGRNPARTQIEPIVELIIVRSRLHAVTRP